MRKWLIYFFILFSCVSTTWAQDSAPNRVLSLDGDGDYVEMADSENLNNITSQVTIEAWIRPTAYSGSWISIIHKEDERITTQGNRSYVLQLNWEQRAIHLASAPEGMGSTTMDSPANSIVLNTWYHVAGIVDADIGVMRIYINGAEVARSDFSGKSFHASELPLRVGWTHGPGPLSASFAGQIDEVRIWGISRTQAEIRATMYSALSGNEPGLMGYWRFNDTGDAITDSSPSRIRGKLMGDAHLAEAQLPDPDELVIPTVLSGDIRDESGHPVRNVSVWLERDGIKMLETETGLAASYNVIVDATGGPYDLSAAVGDLGAWHLNIQLAEGEQRTLNLVLKEAISIEGTLLMMDDMTPHVAVPVQAIRDGEAIATILSDESGKYRFINLRPGSYQLRCQILGGYVYYGDERASGPEDQKARDFVSLHVESGKALKGIDFRFAPFKKGSWRNYDTLDGLAINSIWDIYRDPDGVMWFGTEDGGVSRYDGREFATISTKDGLVHSNVRRVYRDPSGAMWFATFGGVSRYDGQEFVNFTTENGLPSNNIWDVYADPDGTVWFATVLGGVCRYDGKSFTTLTAKDGLANNVVYDIYRDPDGVMWFATYGGISRYDGEEFVNFTTKDGLVDDWTRDIHCDPEGNLWFGTWDDGVSRYDGKEFVNFTTADGLPDNRIRGIQCDRDGIVWFATWGGVSRYDGQQFVNFTTADGLGNNYVNDIHVEPDGVVWFATGSNNQYELGGVSRYDPRTFTTFTRKDGLVDDFVFAYSNADGAIWLGTRRGGAIRYDGREFVNFTEEDGLTNKWINTIHQSSDGTIWLGTIGSGIFRYDGTRFTNTQFGPFGSQANLITSIDSDRDGAVWIGTNGGGAFRYDGKEFINLSTEDGLVSNGIIKIHCAPDGAMWFGAMGSWGGGGLSRYDGRQFRNFTMEDGLIDNSIISIYGDTDGIMWFGTIGCGGSRYDGKHFVSLTTDDGLAHNSIIDIYRDQSGWLWFATSGGGMACYDGTAWTSLDPRDGLASKTTCSVYQDSDGYFWFGTEKGLTRYLRNDTPPIARIISLITDRTYTNLSRVPAFSSGTRVTIEYNSIDFKTIPSKRQYRCRISEIDSDWRKPTKETSFDFIFDKPGKYTFQVQAIDRDLNYSKPSSLKLTVVSPFYLRAVFLIPSIGSGVIILAALVILAAALVKRRRQVHAYQQLAVAELQDAREMQISLLPEAAPPVEGMEIAGKSVTANTVGGDFFDYIRLPDGKVGIAIADVSGKGLRAAMNANLASGMLDEVAITESSCGRILSRLNAHLHPRMEKQMFTAFSFAILDKDTIHWSNAAQPLPLIKRGSAASEVMEDGQLPLGMMPDVVYPDYHLNLQTGDIVIFYTDGIIEAENEAREIYGTDRLLDTVAGIDPTAGAEDVINAILQDVTDFVGAAERYDDMTIVVVKLT